MKVKICGITNLPDAMSAVLLGADYVGFLVEISFAQDKVDRKEAKDIMDKLPEEVKSVFVTYEQKAKDIIEIAKEINPDVIQLHNDIDPDEIKKIRKDLKGIELIKTINVKNIKSIDEAKEYEQYADYLLLDTQIKGKKGGTGKTHNWDISKEIVKRTKKPVFLAGGLNPDNVEEAIKKVSPFAVDTNSGVETESRTKDYEKMKMFIARAKGKVEGDISKGGFGRFN
ncbi:MAG: phosphoribosylanthranilate isomerase [Nanoarchaeota archaeon]